MTNYMSDECVQKELARARNVARRGEELAPRDVPVPDVNELIDAGVDAGHAEEVVADVEELNRYLRDTRTAVHTVVANHDVPDASLLEVWLANKDAQGSMEGVLNAGGLFVHDMADEYDENEQAYEILSVIWREILKRDDLVRRLGEIAR